MGPASGGLIRGGFHDIELFDATTNANAAYALYVRSGGWGPWT